MYNMNDFFEMVRVGLQLIMKCLPYIIIHFVALIGLRKLLLKLFNDHCFGGSVFFGLSNAIVYRYCFLMLMLLFSWFLSVIIYLYMKFGFYFSGDFVFMAGVLLGWRKGWSLLLVNLLLLPVWYYYTGRSALIISYVMLDAVIYFLVGIFSGSQYDFIETEYGYNDILLVCVNKLVAALLSAACWVLLTQESWFAGINLLVFRLVGWPMASLPMIFFVLYLMKQDARQMVLRPA